MEQFRQIGEVLGGLKALMVLKEDIQINQKQCCLLLDMFDLAFKTIAGEIKQSLRLEEKNIKWKAMEQPLKELYRVFKDGELYIRHCLEIKDWWGKALCLHQNKDCVEFLIHNLLCCFPVVMEAIEIAGEISGLDQDEILKKKHALERKCEKDWNDLKLFQWKFGKQYLVSRDICSRLESVWKEDKWRLIESIREKKNFGALSKHERRLGDILLKKLNGLEPFGSKQFPSSTLVDSKDYQVRRRLGSGSEYKEIQWLGESFVLRHFYGEIDPLVPEISSILLLSHTNVMQHLCGFYDEENKECFLVMELMSKDLCSHMRENSGPKRRIPFSLPVVVDIMLQIARGMEYLHSQKIYHGDLHPSNILLKARNSSLEGYVHAKIAGFGLTSVISPNLQNTTNQNDANPFIWHAPEVLAEQEKEGACSSKYTEKADVYSFGMICFQLLTGKLPFEDGHLQGEKMSRNIRAGERPLFSCQIPKYLSNLIKRCWQTEPAQRPSFSSLCRILRFIKRFIVMNPDQGLAMPPSPTVEYYDIEAVYMKKFISSSTPDVAPVSQIPFELFAYRLMEKERNSPNFVEQNWERETASEAICREANSLMEDLIPPFCDKLSVCSEIVDKRGSPTGRSSDKKASKTLGSTPRTPRTPRVATISPLNPCRQSMSMSINVTKPARQSAFVMSSGRRSRRSGQTSASASDSELVR
ncbi:protein of unknown function DUF1221 [Dillenia turbinata]|uniref:Protein kinase domain-containing protein n=1 Tax=Dillenia turbinata TaxID=194707 RepID=A0AAN8VTE5_9MAGN